MDNVEKLLEEIRKDVSIWTVRNRRGEIKPVFFSNSFLNTVANIFEKYGFGTTRTYLLGQRVREQNQADSLLKIIDKFEKVPEIKGRYTIGRLIIKTLLTLKPQGGRR